MKLKPGAFGEVIAVHARDRTATVAVAPGMGMSQLLHADVAHAGVIEEAFRSGFRKALPEPLDQRAAEVAEDAAWRSFARDLPGGES